MNVYMCARINTKPARRQNILRDGWAGAGREIKRERDGKRERNAERERERELFEVSESLTSKALSLRIKVIFDYCDGTRLNNAKVLFLIQETIYFRH